MRGLLLNSADSRMVSRLTQMMVNGAEIDFEEETFITANSESAILPWDAVATMVLTQTNAMTAASTGPGTTALYSLKSGAYSPRDRVLSGSQCARYLA